MPIIIDTCTYTDPCEYQASFRVGEVNLVFACPGDFKARLTLVELPNLQLLCAQESLPRIAYLALAPKHVVVSFPAQIKTPMIWNGIRLQPGDIVFHSLGERMHQRTNGASRWCVLSLTSEKLATYGKAITGHELVPPSASRVLRPPAHAALFLQRLHAKACRLAQTNPEIVTHPGVAHAMEQELLHALVNCLAPAAPTGRDATRQRHAQILVQWEDVFANYADCPLRMAKLCAVIGVSERTLRAACHDVVGMAPGQYDRLRRLNLVRCELRHANPATTPVSEIAERHGFSELGRFAVLYRRLFGEKPSETLRAAADFARSEKLPEMHSASGGRRPT